MDKELAREQILKLVEKLNSVFSQKKFNRYNEEMTKKDFILPLFRALGWDVENSSEVSAEEKISKGRVDYSFSINGIPKFFLEAKPLTELLDKEKYAEQAINYSYLKGCTWAVLTNFREVRIYNADWKTSSTSLSLFKSLHYKEFQYRFDDLWLLSRESFQNGTIDKIAEDWGKKAKKVPIDKQLLEDFTRFRELLSKNITRLNQNLNEDELDESVQRILDRLIFIRNCEDRELEEKKLLPIVRQTDLKKPGQLIKHLRNVFTFYDQQYNSKIFAKHLCDSLNIDNEVLAEIIEGLHTTADKSISYDFSVIESDVLGNIYEQYLGHILKKTAKRAKLSKSHAHRKEQGIYYTPTYIVDYIVRNTLGELLKGKKPEEVDRIRVLDPACGSGSFLTKAFDYFNEYYLKHDRGYAQSELDFASGLPFSRKVKILTNNIFGVDLDKQAVEIAQLNLLLKIAERGHHLPLLQNNIKCGNSLIDDPAVAGDKAFKWEEEFKEIIEEGGFDIVIGNPPYVRQERLKEIKPALQKTFEVFNSTSDIYTYFYELSWKVLRPNGVCGFITSNKFLRAKYGEKLREFLKEKTTILQIIDLGGARVFEDATVDTCIVIFKKKKPEQNHKVKFLVAKDFTPPFDTFVSEHLNEIEQRKLGVNAWTLADNNILNLKEKIEKVGTPLKDWDVKIYYGIKTGYNEAFIIDTETRNRILDNCKTEEERKRTEEIIKPILRGRDIRRYYYKWAGLWLIKIESGWTNEKRGKEKPEEFFKKMFPSVYQHLISYANKANEGRRKGLLNRDDQGDYWWELRDCDYYPEFEKEKIVWQEMTNEGSFAWDTNKIYVNQTCYIMTNANKYILALLNSKIVHFYFSQISYALGLGAFRWIKQFVERLPIPKIPESEQQPIISLVDKMLELNQRLNQLGDKITDERGRIEEEIRKTDARIDDLVFQIYEITDQERKIIEESLE